MTTQPHWVPAVPPGPDELPCEDGEPMETPKHRRQMNILIESLELAWRDRDDFYVGGNMFVYFSELQTRRNDFRGPDFFVVLDTERRDRKSWVVWYEGGKTPDVVIELHSESTRAEDLGPKKDVYEKMLKVSFYYGFDPETGKLVGFELLPARGYVPLELNSHGRLECRALSLELGIHQREHAEMSGPWLRWFTPSGELLLLGDEIAEREKQNAEREKQNAEREKQNAEREKQNAEREKQNAEREKQNAEREYERAERLAEQIAAYEAKFGKLPT